MPILTYCNQNGSCPAPLYNAMDEGASGQSYIQDISTMPTYTWGNAQPDDYGASAGMLPNTFTEYGYSAPVQAFPAGY